MDLDRAPAADEALGMAWWNGLTEVERANWLQRAGTSVVAEAWAFFKYQRDDADVDDRTLDSSFWFDEFTLPQYDYHEAQGRITQEEADQYRKLRADMGLPMDFGELKSRPDPQFEWIYRLGGPSLGMGCDVELEGLHWSAHACGEHGLLRFVTTEVPGGYLEREVRRPHDCQGASWSATYKVPGAEGVYARASGKSDNFADAVRASTEVDFEPILLAGLQFYRGGWNSQSLVAAFDGQELHIYPGTTDDAPSFRWELSLPDKSSMYRLASLFGSTSLRGHASTAEAAASDALAAMNRAMALCGEMVGSEPFVAGLQAGKASVRADLAAFLLERA